MMEIIVEYASVKTEALYHINDIKRRFQHWCQFNQIVDLRIV